MRNISAGGSVAAPVVVGSCEPDKSDNAESMRYILGLSNKEVLSRMALLSGVVGICDCNGISMVSTDGRSLINLEDESGVVTGGVLGVVGVGKRGFFTGVPRALRKKPPPDFGDVVLLREVVGTSPLLLTSTSFVAVVFFLLFPPKLTMVRN